MWWICCTQTRSILKRPGLCFILQLASSVSHSYVHGCHDDAHPDSRCCWADGGSHSHQYRLHDAHISTHIKMPQMEVRLEGFSFLCRWDGDQTIPLKCRSVKPDLAPLSGTTWSLNCPNMIRHSANGCLGGGPCLTLYTTTTSSTFTFTFEGINSLHKVANVSHLPGLSLRLSPAFLRLTGGRSLEGHCPGPPGQSAVLACELKVPQLNVLHPSCIS